MAASPALRPVACVAALNATFQGLIGVVFSVIALCVCFCGLGSAPQASANDLYQYITSYLQGDECRDHGSSLHILYSRVTTPTALRVWMALALFFSASMLVSSVFLVVAVAKRWSDEKLQITLVSWLFINFFTCVDDLILGYVFGNDYLTSLDLFSQQDNVGPLTLGILTFVTVRCVYLWFMNLAFIIYLLGGARALHKYLNEQIPSQDQEPIERWPTLDDFGKSKVAEVERTPTAVNPKLTDRVDNSGFPEYSAMARWPTLNGQPQSMRETRVDREQSRETRSKTVREYSLRRQEGVDNPGYESDTRYYLRLQSDTGSTRDYEDEGGERRRSVRNREGRSHDRSRREVRSDSITGHYKRRTPEPPTPSHGYLDEHGIPIPPVDYLDLQPEEERRGNRPLSLQEAILDRTLRLKKVPDELRKGVQK